MSRKSTRVKRKKAGGEPSKFTYTVRTMSLAAYWRTIRTLTVSQMKARYRRTFAGFLWVLLSPIIIFSAQAIVFKNILRIDVPNYAVFLLGGLLPWVFIVNSLEMGVTSLTSARQLLVAFKVEPAVILGGSLLDNWLNFVAAFLLILAPTIALSGTISLGLLLLPFATLTLLAGMAGIVALLAMLNVFYRDMRFLVHFSIGVLFFLTPIFYPLALVPESFRWLAGLNPLYLLIQPVRECIYAFAPAHAFAALGKSAVVACVSLALAQTYWKKKRNEFYHSI